MPGCEPGGKGSTPFGYPYTSVLLGEPAASKTASRGSTPRARAFCPDCVADCTRLSEGRSPGSSPGRDTDSRSLRVCRIARQSSKLQDEVQLLGGLLRDLRPRGVLDWHATLRRLRSRFDSWRGRCDAGARRYGGCLQSSFRVGSTPTGVSHNEYKRIFKQGFDVVWPAAHEPSDWSWHRVFRTWILTMAMSARLAQ
jgi:hypothetical protein